VVFYAIAPACTSPLSLGGCLNVGGFLTVNGVSAPNDDKRALVIVTGRSYTGQSRRPCGSVTDCLEDTENTNGDNIFVKPIMSLSNNDQLVVVSP
jgi:hypothetical protein